MKILVTGAAGFIGFHVTKQLLLEGHTVIGVDNMNDYYSPVLKKARLNHIINHPHFTFYEIDITDAEKVNMIFTNNETSFDCVIHLAAQAGVRYSLTNPEAYIQSNINGFFTIIEAAKTYEVKHFMYASSSSVYGDNEVQPLQEQLSTNEPLSLYAATKKSNELLAHTYSHLYGLPTTGLRFFSVYGPWGRPDMALFQFTEKINKGEPIEVYNEGQMLRDFTYVEDVVESIVRLLKNPPVELPPYRILNIGNCSPILLKDFIEIIEKTLNKKAIQHDLPMQMGDVQHTYANVDALFDIVHYKPTTSVEQGVKAFISWYKSFYGEEEGEEYA